MIPWLVASAVAVASACDAPDAAADHLAELPEAARMAAIQAWEGHLGPLLTAKERALPSQDLAALALGRMRASCELLQLRPEVGTPDRSRLERILGRPEFSEARQRQDWMAELRRIALEWLDDLTRFRATQQFSTVTRALVLAVAVVVALVSGLRMLRTRRRRRASADVASSVQALHLESPSIHLERARRELATNAREAIRQALLGLLSALERHRWARPDRVKTNRELAAELPKRGAPADVAARATRLLQWFDRAFYSLQQVTSEQAQGFIADVTALEAGIAHGEGRTR